MLGIRVLTAAAIAVATIGAQAGCDAAELTGAEILSRALDLNGRVHDYTATVSMQSDVRGGPPEVPAFKVYFKRPDKIHIESRSIVAVRKDMLSFGNLAKRVQEGADVLLIGEKKVDGATLYTLKLVPKEAPEGVKERVLLVVNGATWTVARIEVTDGQKTHAAMDWHYVLVGGQHRMPSRIRCTIPDAPKRDGELGGWVEIAFTDYAVNTGLSDSIFEEESD